MFTESESLRARLQQLRSAGHSLADLLQLNAERLDSSGAPPPHDLLEEIHRYRDQFARVSSLLDPASTSSAPFQSLGELDAELERRESTRQAITIARAIQQISPRDQQRIPALEELHVTARETIASLGSNLSQDEIATLYEGKHAWCHLLRMISDGETLPDSEWTALNTSVESRLGTSLAIAAARGRLTLPSTIEEPSILQFPPVITASEPMESTVAPRPTLKVMAVSPVSVPPLTLEVAQLSDPVALFHPAMQSESTTVQPTVPSLEKDEATNSSQAGSHLVLEDLRSSPGLNPSQLPVPIKVVPASNSTTEVTPPLVPTTSEATAPPQRPSAKLRFVTSSSSIFDDDSDDDELIANQQPNAIVENSQRAPVLALDGPAFPLAEQLLAHTGFDDASGAAASLATMILNGQEEDRVDLLPDLILHLIHEGRPGLAYHLSICLESRGNNQRPFVPSWLIRTWTFGHALVFPKGQLAGLLQDDLQNRSTVEFNHSSRDWKLAMSLLIRASTLRPAIIAPSTRAASILRDFDLKGGCVQLYNYCSRIGVYGERIQGVLPGLFKLTSATVPYSEQLSVLRSDIAAWKESTENARLKYLLTQPLFQKAGWSLRAGSCQRQPAAAHEWMNWQIAYRMCGALILPVIEDRRTELARVKAEVEEISTRLSATEAGDGRQQFAHPEIRSFLRQAVTFAQRWISLHSMAATSDSQNYLPQPAVELRSEIQTRHEPVMEELRIMAEEETAFEVRMTVACLMLSVMEIRNLVDPQIASESREADPRHLLHSELLKISGIRLGANWEPDTDPHILEDEILNFLSQPQPHWATAFKMQLAQGNHLLAERILSLPLWSNEEREVLQGALELDRERLRTNFTRELNEVNKLLTESVHLDILNEAERSGFETRLDRLQRISSTENDLSSRVQELERVRELIVKRREREAERIRNRLRQLSSSPAPDATAPASPSPEADSPSPRKWLMDFDMLQ